MSVCHTDPNLRTSVVSTELIMPRCVAFLRSINVGSRRLAMTELKQYFEALGLANVVTFIASGNVIFETKTSDTGMLEQRIEKHLANITWSEQQRRVNLKVGTGGSPDPAGFQALRVGLNAGALLAGDAEYCPPTVAVLET